MTRSIRTVVARGSIIVGLAAVAALGTAGAAFAEQNAGATIPPGNQACTDSQYAGTQVRGFGTASGRLPQGGAKFKILRNGVAVNNTLQREVAVTLQNLPPTFPGSGNYQFCATNTGNASVSVTLNLKTDNEVH